MKKISVFLSFLLCSTLLFAQTSTKPNVSIRWAPAGLIYGSFGVQAEYNFGKNSLTAKIGIPSSKEHSFEYDTKDANFTMKAMSFLAGYRTYLSRKHMSGFYFEPYFKYVHHTSEGTGNAILGGENVVMNFTNEYNGAGVGAQLGVQFLILKRIAIDLYFLGLEINSSKDNLKALETSNTISWTSVQASDAEKDIRDFIDQFPFVKKKTSVMVDQSQKMVTANFKGALPGFRGGISIGIAF